MWELSEQYLSEPTELDKSRNNEGGKVVVTGLKDGRRGAAQFGKSRHENVRFGGLEVKGGGDAADREMKDERMLSHRRGR